MKKSLFYSLVLSLFGFGVFTFSASAVEPVTTNLLIQPRTVVANLSDGELIKGESYKTIYYLAEDGKRYVFPNSKTYFSWYDDFTSVREVTDEELFSYPLGGNVRYRPGSVLVKITTNPKVYAVGENGKLRWVKSEKAAKALYGDNWNKLIDDIADSFFTNYEIGDDIDSADDFDPTVIEEEYPSISHNRGLKARKMIQKRSQNALENKCGRLEDAVNKLQKRARRYGIEVPNVGDDYLSECVENSQTQTRKRIRVCERSAEGEEQVVDVLRSGLRKMLRGGATLGECVVADSNDNVDDEDLVCDEGEEAITDNDGNQTCTVVAEEDEDMDEEDLTCDEGEEVITDDDGNQTCTTTVETVS